MIKAYENVEDIYTLPHPKENISIVFQWNTPIVDGLFDSAKSKIALKNGPLIQS